MPDFTTLGYFEVTMPTPAAVPPGSTPAAVHVEVRPGLEVAVAMGTVGRRLSVGIAERIGNPDLAGNVPVMILCELERRGPLRPRDLLEATGLTSGGLTKQLDHLEALGQIERSFGTVPGDRRASVVTLTTAGSTTAISIAEAIEAQLDDLRTFARTMVDLTRA